MGDVRDQDDIDHFFRDALGSGEHAPAPSVWENIEAKLGQDRRRRLLLWWKPIGMAALFLLVTGGVWLVQTESHPHRVAVATSPAAKGPAMQPSSGAPFKMLPLIKGPAIQPPSGPEIAMSSSPQKIVIGAGQSRQMDAPHPNTTGGGHVISNRFAVVKLSGRTAPQILTRLFPSHTVPRGPIQPVTHRHRLELTVFALHELAAYNLADHDSTGARGQEIEKRQGKSFSRSVGFLFSYPIGTRWVVQSGLSLTRSVTIGKPGTVVAIQDNNGKTSYLVNTITGYGYVAPEGLATAGDTAMTGKVTGKLNYIALPVIVSRQWERGRFSVLAGAGLDVKLLTHATIETSILDAAGTNRQKLVTQYGLRKIDFGWQVRGECRYRLSRDYAATLLATFKSSVGPVNVHTPYSTYPYNLGIGVGITRTF